MRKIVLGLAVSLDGYIEDANGGYDWCFTDQDYGLNEFYQTIDALLIGRKSYELLQSMGGTIPDMPPMHQYLVSNTITETPGGTTLVQGDIVAAIQQIKQTSGKNIWLFGGARLTHALMDANLVDEYWLSVHPVLLGGGKPWFGQANRRQWLELLASKQYETGLVSLRYGLKQPAQVNE